MPASWAPTRCVGESVVTWLWGGYAVGNPTLQRFFSLHYLMPFVIVGVVVLHVWALHVVGQNNPAGVEPSAQRQMKLATRGHVAGQSLLGQHAVDRRTWKRLGSEQDVEIAVPSRQRLYERAGPGA